MLIHNTLTEKKEPLSKPENGNLKMFVCGPTVYDAPHIGNMRTYTVFDIFARYLRHSKIDFFYLQNITDIDDKIIKRALDEKINPISLAKKIERLYHKSEKSLDIKSVTEYARASNYIYEIVRQIRTLEGKGFAYRIENDGYYFNIAKFSDYGKLARRTSSQAEDGVSRIDESVNKKNKGDFNLWKFHQKLIGKSEIVSEETKKYKMKIVDGEPAWETPLGYGRPGWHIEDTAITEKFFGPQYDIHGGGVDIKFPHHEAEIAQQEAASGKKPFVKLWMHVGALLVNGKKMSKSLGNFITLDDFIKKYSAQIFRYIIASHHYRSPLDYTDAIAEQAKRSVYGIKEFLAKLELVIKSGRDKNTFNSTIESMSNEYMGAMNDDLNTPKALASIFNFINANQKTIWFISKSEARKAKSTIKELLDILGVSVKNEKFPEIITILSKEREALRGKKDFVSSDAVRDKIDKLGYKLDDTPLGQLIIKNS